MSVDSPASPDRRSFISLLSGVASLIGLLRVTAAASQTGAPAQRISESDPLAQSLGYKNDASEVDKSKFPTFKAGQTCANCRFFQGAAGQPYGPCQIFSGKLVSSKGWCASYNAKA
jgi:High potential iron-sulfur protein